MIGMSMFWLFGALFTFVLLQINAQMGFAEVLRKVDLQKPLPFSPGVTVAGEIAGKAGLALLFIAPYALAGLVIQPSLWLHALLAIPFLLTFAGVLAGSALLVTILFPDIDDPLQRGFRGLMHLIGVAITASPGAAVFGAILAYAKSPLGALIAIPINLAVTAALAWGAGQLYATFNPSE